MKYQVGEHVWVKGGTYAKLARPLTGPYEIISIHPTNGTALVKWVSPYNKNKIQEKRFHMSNFSPCRRTDLDTRWDPQSKAARPLKAPLPSFPDSFRKRRHLARNLLDKYQMQAHYASRHQPPRPVNVKPRY